MTIALPPSGKSGIFAVFGRKELRQKPPAVARPIAPHELARLFHKQDVKKGNLADVPARLNDNEQQDRDRLVALRRALYTKP